MKTVGDDVTAAAIGRAKARGVEAGAFGATPAQRAAAERIAELLASQDRTRSRRRLALRSLARWGTPLAGAAAVAIYVARGGEAPPNAAVAYAASVTGHVARDRAASAPEETNAVLFDQEGAAQEVVLNPRAAIYGAPPVVTVLAARTDGVTPLDERAEVSPLGGVRFEVPAGSLAGVIELRVVLSGAATSAQDVRAASARPMESVARGTTVVVIPVTPAARPPLSAPF